VVTFWLLLYAVSFIRLQTKLNIGTAYSFWNEPNLIKQNDMIKI